MFCFCFVFFFEHGKLLPEILDKYKPRKINKNLFEKSSVMPGFWICISQNIRKVPFPENIGISSYQVFLGKNIRNFFRENLWELRPESVLGSPIICYYRRFTFRTNKDYKTRFCNIFKMFITSTSEFKINFYKNILLNQHLYMKRQRFWYSSDTKYTICYSNLSKRTTRWCKTWKSKRKL